MIDKIKDAVSILYGFIGSEKAIYKDEKESINTLIDLAERYISVEGKMPEQLKVIYNINKHEETYVNAWNDAIDECTLITTKLLAEKDSEIERLKFHNDCRSELCECAEQYGFPCYRHLQEAYNEAKREIELLKNALAQGR